MADIEQLKRALVNADRAGDANAARALAREIRRAQSSQPQASTQELTTMDRFVRGLRDPIDAGAQMLVNALPEGVVKAVDRLNNWLAENIGIVDPLPEGGVDQQVREAEKAYQAARAAQGEDGIDWARIGGNVLSPANLALASRVPVAASLGGRVATGAAAGAGFGALTPVGEGEFVDEKMKQASVGAIAGGVVPGVAGALARVISPRASTNPALKALQSEGVKPTVGQTLGGRWNALEEKAMSIPLVGDAIASARNKSLTEFNRAAINRASSKAGVKVDEIGQEGIKKAGDALSKAYDDALSKVKGIQFDEQFVADLAQLQQMASGLVPGMRAKFNKTLADIFQSRRSPNGAMLGSTYKKVDSELGNIAARYGKSSVASEQELGDALKQLQALLREQMMRSNPQVAKRISELDEGWANLVRIESAAKAAKNAEGVFTPAQLNAAIQGADKSVRGRAVARGTAMMQDLGRAGQSVIGNKVPNSFTTDRALIAGGALGSYFINPVIPASLVAGSALYAPQAQRVLNYLLTARPQSANALAGAVRKASPAVIPGAANLGLQVMGE